MTAELIDVGGLLATGGDSLSQGSLRRAISTAYHGLFHALARSNADVLVGTSVADLATRLLFKTRS